MNPSTIAVGVLTAEELMHLNALASYLSSAESLSVDESRTHAASAFPRLLATIAARDEQLALARGAYDNLEMKYEALRLNQAQTDEEIARLRNHLRGETGMCIACFSKGDDGCPLFSSAKVSR